jgi:radical SAM protein with 4Fe4S-binding SPASM domain
MAAIRRCQSVPSLIDKMTWRVTLFKGNKNSIHDIINMADEIGVKKVHFGTMEPVGRGTEYPNLILDDEERFNCFMQIHKASKECSSVSVLGDICSSFKVYGPYESNETHCQLGSSIRIDSDGNIYACQLFISPELRLGNIAEMSIASTDVRMGIERLNNIKNRRPQDIEACVKCVWKNFCCSGCMAKAFEQYGTFWEKDPQCGVFKRICSYNVCERLS